MRFGFVYPHPDPAGAVEAAVAAEAAGWDGFFVWEAIWGADPWATLGAIAVETKRIRIGTLLTPVPVRRPWKLAAEAATVDVLSAGRLILAVGLGAPDTGFAAFGAPTDTRERAELLDEGLALLERLWAGGPFPFRGHHYIVEDPPHRMAPEPVQRRNGAPHVPIWVVGAWGRSKSMARVRTCDGMLPHLGRPDGTVAAPGDLPLAEIRRWLDHHTAAGRSFDLIVEGTTPPGTGAATPMLEPLRSVGVTWWIESRWNQDTDAVDRRLRAGPPS